MEAEQVSEVLDSAPAIQDQQNVEIEQVLDLKSDNPGDAAESDSPVWSGEQTFNGHDAAQSPMDGEEAKAGPPEMLTVSDKTWMGNPDMEREEDKSPEEISEEAVAGAAEQQFGCGDQLVTETLPGAVKSPEDNPPAPEREPENVSDPVPASNTEPENLQVDLLSMAEPSPERLPLDDPVSDISAGPEPEPEKVVQSVTLTAGLCEQALAESLTQLTLEEAKPVDKVEEMAGQVVKQGEADIKMEVEVIKEVLVEVKPQKTAALETVPQPTMEAARAAVEMEEPVAALKEVEVEKEKSLVAEAVAEKPFVTEAMLAEAVAEKPLVTEAVAEKPLVTEAVAEKPLVTTAVVDEAVAEKPLVIKAVVAEAVAEKPLVTEAVALVEVEKAVQAAVEKVLETVVEKAEQQPEKEEEEEEPVPAPGSLSFALLDQEKTKAILQSSHTLVVLRGLPGSGKSLLARAISDSYQGLCTVFSADDHGVKPDNPGASEEGYKALDDAVEACCRAGGAASVIVVDDTNHVHERLARLGELAEEHGLVAMFLEPRTEWRRDLPRLAKKSRRGLGEAKIQAMQGLLEETSLPLFFGWFLLPNVQDKVRCTSLDFLKQLDTLEAFKKHLADFTGEGEKEVDLEQYFQVKGALHCTTKYCDYGKAEGAVEYAEMPAVQKEYGSAFELSLTALFVTPRTVGARVSLSADQLVLWPADAEKQAEPAVPTAGSLPQGSRAHITLGCAEGVEPVQTGLDLLEILALQDEGQQGEPVEEMELGGSLTYYGKGRWMLSLKEPVSAQACFSSLYGRKKPEDGKKEEEKKKKQKCVIL